VAALEAHGLAAATLGQQSQLIVRRADEGGLVTRPFSADEAVATWRAAAETALAGGFSGLRLVVDMSWVLHNPSSLAQLAEYEARADRFFASADVKVVCQYNQRRFPEEILLDTLRTHPAAVLDGDAHDNTFYVPPDIFLRHDRQAQFYWYLSRLSSNDPASGGAPAAPTAKASPWEAAHWRRSAVATSVQSTGNRPPRADERSADWRWQIYCLGELRVHRHDGSPVNWNVAKGATKKSKTLFAYLLERGKTGATMEQLADLLWPDKTDTQQALGRLYHTIHALRLALETDLARGQDSRHLLIREGRCFLRLPEETWIDATAFEQFCYKGERLLEAGDDDNALACYLAAEKLYGGDLLADIPLTYAERTSDDWCWSRRYWLQEMYLKLLVGLAGIYRRRSAIQEAMGYSRNALALDPANEAAHREMMQILHCAGRPDAVDRQYHLCRQILLRQDDRQPEAETARLYEELSRRSVPPPVSGRRPAKTKGKPKAALLASV
jgi:DNA-binding SARP family transcriptional activator